MASYAYNTPMPVSGGIPADAVPLSFLFRDPALRRTFERAERDGDVAPALPCPAPRPLIDGSALTRQEIERTINDLIARLDTVDGDAARPLETVDA